MRPPPFRQLQAGMVCSCEHEKEDEEEEEDCCRVQTACRKGACIIGRLLEQQRRTACGNSPDWPWPVRGRR